MLLGGALQHLWPHDRADYFFTRACWGTGQLGLPVLARLHVPDKSNGPSKVYMAAAVVTLLAFASVNGRFP